MKDVLQSMSPYYYYLIAEDLKPMEIRKSIPKDPDWSGVVHVYCTKDKKSFARIPKEYQEKYRSHMGKVGLHYKCDLVEKIRTPYKYTEHPKMPESVCSKSRLSSQELVKYIGLGGTGYGWHISDIVIYDKPKELIEFKRPCDGNCQECRYALWQTYTFISESKIVGCTQKVSVPQSWCYVEGLNNGSEKKID